MGFFNNVSNSFSRGKNAVSRSSKILQLNMQENELMKQRQNLAAQLGASLYDQTRNDPRFTAGREPLYSGIANIDAQRSMLEAQVAQLQADQAAQTAAAQTYRCPNCGSTVSATDMFCSGCGLPIAQVMAAQPQQPQYQQAQYQQAATPVQSYSSPVAPAFAAAPTAPTGRVCPNCGAPMGPDDVFCMNCGTRVKPKQAAAPAVAERQPALASDAAPEADSESQNDTVPIAAAPAPAEPAPAAPAAAAPAVDASADTAPAEPAAAEAAPAFQTVTQSVPSSDAPAGQPVATAPADESVTTEASPANPVPAVSAAPFDAPVPEPTMASSDNASDVVPVVSPDDASATSEDRPRFCPNCGNEVGPGEKFCFACGAKLE